MTVGGFPILKTGEAILPKFKDIKKQDVLLNHLNRLSNRGVYKQLLTKFFELYCVLVGKW